MAIEQLLKKWFSLVGRVDCFVLGILQHESGKHQRGSAGLHSPLPTLCLDPSPLLSQKGRQCRAARRILPAERHQDKLSTPQKAISWLSGIYSWSWGDATALSVSFLWPLHISTPSPPVHVPIRAQHALPASQISSTVLHLYE